jgi:hypothetical protein
MKHALLWAIAVLALTTGAALADPCLVVYPDVACRYHYDPSEYYTVGPGHPCYDPVYDRGGEVLLEIGTCEVDLSIYQAPGLAGFEVSYDGNEGYFFTGTEFNLILDGFSNEPTVYENILIMFDRVVPVGCMPEILINGMPVTGFSYPAGDLAVSTPTPDGNNYSDVMMFAMSWRGCYGVHIWAFSDENYNGIKDGGECFTAYSHDTTIPVESSSWGAIKSTYR